MIQILIFTYERPKYLKRSINYWSKSNYEIIIADGSKTPYKENLPNNFKYFHLPKTSLLERTVFLSSIVSLDYAVFCADDDFHSFHGIKKVCDFLDKNKEYASAQGLFLRVGEKKKPKSLVFGVGYSANISIDTKIKNFENEKLLKYMLRFKFPICYSIMRKSVFKNYIKVLSGLNLGLEQSNKGISVQLFEDIMPYIVFLSGHYKTIQIFYSMRQNQIQDYRAYYNNKLYLDDFFADWVKSNDKEWIKIKENINNLIKEKFNFKFSFNEEDILFNYLNKSPKLSKKKKEIPIGILRKIMNQLKIHNYILQKLNYNFINYLSFYNSLKLIKKIVRNSDVEQ